PDVGALMAAADIYCQPNIRPEPFGITFIEAMASGLPVVGTRLGGPGEVITGACGILVEPNDVRALAAALQTLVCDAELRVRLGRGGPTRAHALSSPAARLQQLSGVLESARPAACEVA